MKTTFITDINKIKFEVNTEVARLAFAGELDEKANEIPYKLIPGRTPHYRCCVYREREIIRERVQLAMGRSAMSGQKNWAIMSRHARQIRTGAAATSPFRTRSR